MELQAGAMNFKEIVEAHEEAEKQYQYFEASPDFNNTSNFRHEAHEHRWELIELVREMKPYLHEHILRLKAEMESADAHIDEKYRHWLAAELKKAQALLDRLEAQDE